MKALPGALLICLAGTACGYPQQPQGAPTVDGFVTRVLSPTDFSVNGIRILCGPGTQIQRSDSKATATGCPEQMPFVGEAMTIYGTLEQNGTLAEASRIELQIPAEEDIAGSAVVESVQSARPEVRADGYRVILPPGAAITFSPPLRSLADVKASDWIVYKAKQRPDGVLVASSIRFSTESTQATAAQKMSSRVEGNLRNIQRRFEPWPDTMMEQHVSALGQKLIPGWQRALPDGDPGKLSFQFVVVDGPHMDSEPIPLPNGMVIVARQDVQKLQNDSQMAALLADAIACILERQTWRIRIAVDAAESGESIVDVSESFIAAPKKAGFNGSRDDMRDVLGEEYAQSGRVALHLMHNAGFDIEQAPVAWWLLANRDKPLTAVSLPYRSAMLYQALGTLWNNPAAGGPESAASSGLAGPSSAQ